MLYALYATLIRLATPLLRLHLRARVRKGKEDPARRSERFGRPSAPRFATQPVWVHAASVGEVQTATIAIDLIHEIDPNLPIILTSGTTSSAALIAKRTIPHTVYQYAPIDHPGWVSAFLDYWTPCAALRLESELWPATLHLLHQRNIPIALLNAHMSERSFSRWSFFRPLIRRLLRNLNVIVAEGPESAERYRKLGADQVIVGENMKMIALPLPVDDAARTTMTTALAGRPCWLYASSHAGEESLACDVHADLKSKIPHLLTIIVPRHPERRNDIRHEITAKHLHLPVQFRSDNLSAPPAPETAIYIADTIGELGLFYSVCPIAVIGRSFSHDGGGGHNPIEAILAGCYPLSGPHVHNLASLYTPLAARGAVEIVHVPEHLDSRLQDLLLDPDVLKRKGTHARDIVLAAQKDIHDTLHRVLVPFLKTASTDAKAQKDDKRNAA